ncbi:hypothetical protein [Pantoea vagans]|uniref:hypothetical protein n=1 Tax=Pantoea vagans TaxID=470934 RepID=UPI00320B584C
MEAVAGMVATVLVQNPALNTITISTIKIRTGMLTEEMVVTADRPTTHQVGKAETRALAGLVVWVVAEARTEGRG